MASYAFDTNEDADTRRRRRRQNIAELLAEQADTKPIQSPWQGAAKMANAGISGLLLGMEEKRDRETAEARNTYGSALSAELDRFGGGGGSPVASALAGKPMGGPIKLGGFEPTVARTLEFEGGLNPRDTNGTPSNFGINAKANPDVDVANLTPQGATEIYRKRYWDAIGADKMDPRLAHVAFDTAVIAGPGKANELLKASGGDPEKFLALREEFQNKLLAANPEKYGPYAKAWGNRVATLRSDVGVGGGGAPGGMMAFGSPPGPGGPIQVAQANTGGGTMNDASRLQAIATDPNAPPHIRERAKLILQSLPKPRDPLEERAKSLQVQKAELELNAMRNPKPAPPPEAIRKLEAVGIDQPTMQAAINDPKHPLHTLVTKAIGGSGVTVNNAVSTAPGPTKNVYETVEKRADEARAAAKSLPSFAEAKRLLDSGNITLGAGADFRVGLEKVGALFGLDSTSASNAETFRSSIAPTVLALVKGLGAGSGISNADLKFAEKAAAGDINLEPATIKRMIQIGEKAARTSIEQHQKMLDSVYPDADQNNRQVRALFGVDPSAYTLPEVQAAEPAATTPPPGAPVRVTSPDEARKLPKGTRIILPDGSPGVVR